MVERSQEVSTEDPQWNERVRGLVYACVIALLSGSLYAFSTFSPDLKAAMAWDQWEIELQGVSMDLGTYLMKPFSGWLLDAYGPTVALGAVAVLGFSGWGAVALSGSVLPGNPYLMACWFFLVGIAIAVGYVTALKTTPYNFLPKHRGKIMGTIAACFGMSATFYTVMYTHVFAGALKGFFLFCALLLGGFYSGGMLVVKKIALPEAVVAQVTVAELESPTRDSSQGGGKMEDLEQEEAVLFQTCALEPGEEVSESSVSSTASAYSALEAREALMGKTCGLMETLRHLCHDKMFWAIYAVFGMSCGCGLFVINNIGHMAEALSGSQDEILRERLVITISVSNCLGRIIGGALLDYGISFFNLILAGSVALAAACTLVAAYPDGAAHMLLISAVGTGIGYGSLWAVFPILLTVRYESLNFGKIYGYTATSPALTGLFFNSVFASYFYEMNASEDGKCYGTSCFFGSSLLVGSFGFAATAITYFVIRID